MMSDQMGENPKTTNLVKVLNVNKMCKNNAPKPIPAMAHFFNGVFKEMLEVQVIMKRFSQSIGTLHWKRREEFA